DSSSTFGNFRRNDLTAGPSEPPIQNGGSDKEDIAYFIHWVTSPTDSEKIARMKLLQNQLQTRCWFQPNGQRAEAAKLWYLAMRCSLATVYDEGAADRAPRCSDEPAALRAKVPEVDHHPLYAAV
ncbi:hypothetical protein BVRB_032630, partial [Beta vulgaris subsp. vulgaris]